MKMSYFIKEDEARAKKWGYMTKDLESDVRKGIDPDMMRLQLEVLLEQQDQYNKRLMEATIAGAANVGTVLPGSLGIIRRVFPRLIAQELLSVQPSDRPDMRAFFLNLKFGTAKGSINAGDRLDQVGSDSKDYATRALETTELTDVYFDIDSQLITAEEKALKAKWTIRAQQDLWAYRKLDAETELTGATSNEIIREIDYLLIAMMVAGATAGNVNWNINAPAAAPWTALDPKIYKQTLYDAMVDGNNLIFKKRFQDATWAVADPDTCTRLEKLEGFKLDDTADPGIKSIGVKLFGTLRNRWTIYKNPGMTANMILMGYKGNEWYETGAVYMPYIPFWASPLVYDVDYLRAGKAVMSRYGKAVLLGDCYATVTLVENS